MKDPYAEIIGKKADNPYAEILSGEGESAGWDQPSAGWGETGQKKTESTTPIRKAKKKFSMQDVVSAMGNMPVNPVMAPSHYLAKYIEEKTGRSQPNVSVAGVAQGAIDTVLGPAQWAANKMGYGDTVNPLVNEYGRYMDENFDKSETGKLIGGLMVPSGTIGKVGSLATKLPRGFKTAGEILTGVGLGYGFGKTALQTDTKDQEDYDLKSDESGRLGALLGGATSTVAPVVRGIRSGLAGTSPGNKLGIKTELKPLHGYDQAEDNAKFLRGEGVESFGPAETTQNEFLIAQANDLSQNRQSFNQRRRQGLDETAVAAEKRVATSAKSADDMPYDNINDVLNAQTNPIRYKSAGQLLDDINTVALDKASRPGPLDRFREATLNAKSRLMKFKLNADQNFSKAAQLAPPGKLDTDSILDAASTAAIDFGTNSAESSAAKNFYKGIVENFGDQSYSGIRKFRSALNERMRGLQTGDGSVIGMKSEIPHLQRLINTTEDSIGTFVQKAGGEFQQAHNFADAAYKAEIAPFKDPDILSILSDPDPATMQRLFDGGTLNTQRKMLDLVGEKGRALLTAQKLDEALSSGVKEGVKGIKSKLDPAKVYDKLDSMRQSGLMAELMPNGEGEGMMRLMGLMDSTKALGASNNYNLPVGQIAAKIKLINWLRGGHLEKLHSDPAGRMLLQKFGKAQPGTREYMELMLAIPKITAPTASSDNEYIKKKLKPGEWRPVDEALNPNE